MRRITEEVLSPTCELDFVARFEDAAVVSADNDAADPGAIARQVFDYSDGLRAGEFLLRGSKPIK